MLVSSSLLMMKDDRIGLDFIQRSMNMDYERNVRPADMERITTAELAKAFIEQEVEAVRNQVGDGKVLLALSGGVDSSVVAALLIKKQSERILYVSMSIMAF